MSGRLTGRVAVVTGAGGGLGSGICRALRDEGAAVAGLEVSDERVRTAGKIDGVVALRADVSDAASVAAARDRVVAEFGRVDVLVNNAAIFPRRPWHEFDGAAFDEVLAVNVRGYFLCARAFYEPLRRSEAGRIINISSTAFLVGNLELTPYIASKGAVVGLTRALARELGPEGITVNAIAPGAFQTDAEAIHPDPVRYNAWVLEQQAIKRRGRPVEVGRLAAFLASDDASFITGQTLVIDGGWALS